MNDKLKIEVSPNLVKCLEILKQAVQQLPPGELRTEAENAVTYVSKTFKGEPQPLHGEGCFPGIPFIPV